MDCTRRQVLATLAAAATATALSSCAQEPTEQADASPLERVKVAIAGKSTDELLSELDERADHYIGLTGNCAQSSFLALRDVFDLPDEGVSKALAAFPGVGLRGETCGTVSGSMMATGLVLGPDAFDDEAGGMRAVGAARHICGAVAASAGSTQCAEILEAATGQTFDFTSEEGFAAYRASDGPATCYATLLTATHAAAESLIEAAKA